MYPWHACSAWSAAVPFGDAFVGRFANLGGDDLSGERPRAARDADLGRMDERASGRAGSLQVSGPAASGTTTVVKGDFLSRPFRPHDGKLIDAGVDQGGHRLLQPLPEGVGISMRIRAVGHPWSRWFGFGELPRPGHRLPMQQVQVRLHDTITSTGSINDGFTVRFGC